jgi:hypothetical protein
MSDANVANLPFWDEVHQEMKLLLLEKTKRLWEPRDFFYLVENGRRLSGGRPNPNQKGTITLVSADPNSKTGLKLAAKLLVEGSHDLATQEQAQAYEAEQTQRRAEAGRARAEKNNTVVFQPPVAVREVSK